MKYLAIAFLLLWSGSAFAQQQTSICTKGATNCASQIITGVTGSAASALVLKASPGAFFSAYVTATASGYLMVFDATSAPGNGSTTAGPASAAGGTSQSGNMTECIAVPASTTAFINYMPGPGVPYDTGIVVMFSSTGCATLTASATAFIHGYAQ